MSTDIIAPRSSVTALTSRLRCDNFACRRKAVVMVTWPIPPQDTMRMLTSSRHYHMRLCRKCYPSWYFNIVYDMRVA